MTERSDVTGLLLAAADGDDNALERLVPIVYTELRRNRAQFLAIVSRLMRQILVDYARRRGAARRGSGRPRIELASVAEQLPAAPARRTEEVLALHQALERLEQINDRHARIVECRFFAGMSIEETAEALSLSPATVKRDWVMARAWLNRELGS
jgi:RNA polymerase sigma-70 factor (ECF subfamily)